jgi:hypothetical protein
MNFEQLNTTQKTIYSSKLIPLICALLLLSVFVQAEDEHTTEQAHHSVQGPRITAIMGYSFINNSFVSESNELLVVPTIGLNFDYFLNEKWGLGLHSDLVMQQFKVEKHDGHEELIRENPIAVCGMGIYKPHERWALLLGYGVEIEKHENLQMIRIGGEYGIPLPKHWEVSFTLEYDYKINSYGAMMFGIGFSRGLKKL